MMFTIYPALHLHNGRVVPLQQDHLHKKTIFSDDPLAVAQEWVACGASWLHIINLDRSVRESAIHKQLLPRLAACGAQIQFGGGVRSFDDIEQLLEMGVERVILGTAAIENPALIGQAVAYFGADHVAVSIDTQNGRVRTDGWQKKTDITPLELGKKVRALGVRTAVYTNLSAQGHLEPLPITASAELAANTGLSIIVSGQIHSLADIQHSYNLANHGLHGIIVGYAIYDGRLNLKDAISLITPEAST